MCIYCYDIHFTFDLGFCYSHIIFCKPSISSFHEVEMSLMWDSINLSFKDKYQDGLQNNISDGTFLTFCLEPYTIAS